MPVSDTNSKMTEDTCINNKIKDFGKEVKDLKETVNVLKSKLVDTQSKLIKTRLITMMSQPNYFEVFCHNPYNNTAQPQHFSWM